MENERLRTEKIPKLLLSLSLPAISAQIVTLIYSAVDRIYIGRMADGALAMAGLGIALPIITIVSAFASLFGRGGAPYAAICMGQNENERAESYLGTSFSMLLLLSLVLTVIVYGFCDPLLLLFGASAQTLPYAHDYLATYALGTVFVQMTMGMNYFITTQGFAKTAMFTTMLGAMLNIVLDPLFIFAFGMGVRGAALATVLSQMISFLWVLGFLFGKKTVLRIRRRFLALSWKRIREICVLGSAPFFMTATEGLLNLCFNRQCAAFGGDMAVSAMTVLFMLSQFLSLFTGGVAQGSQPIVSYNYGAGAYDRVRATLRLCFGANITASMIGGGLMCLFPVWFLQLFNNDPALLAIGAPMLRVYIVGAMFMGAHSS
ncbi:MAG: MATE family efflux transporter, partial [Clostridia bacterium]